MLHLNKSIKQRLLSGGLWAFVSKASSGFLTIALTALLTRLLPPEDVGILFLSFSIIILLSFFTRFGLDQLVIKLVGEALASNRYIKARIITNRSIVVVLFSSLIVSIILFLFFNPIIADNFIHNNKYYYLRLYLSLWVPLTAIQLIFAEIFRAYHNIKYASIFSGGTAFGGFSTGLVTGAILFSIYLTGAVITLSDVFVIVLLVTAFFLIVEYFIIRKMINFTGHSHDVDVQSEIKTSTLIKSAFPFFISVFSFMLLLHVDTVILGFYSSEEEVALYAASTRIAKLVFMATLVVNEVIAPMIVELNTNNEKLKLEKLLRVTATMAAIPSSVVLLVFIFAADSVLDLVYGEFYKTGGVLLIILSIGQLISVWTGSSSYALNLMGYQRVRMYISLITSLLAILACLALVKPFGAIAVATIISAAWVVQSVVSLLYLRRLAGFWSHAGVLIPLKEIKKTFKII